MNIKKCNVSGKNEKNTSTSERVEKHLRSHNR